MHDFTSSKATGMTDMSVSDGGRGDRVFGSEPVEVETLFKSVGD